MTSSMEFDDCTFKLYLRKCAFQYRVLLGPHPERKYFVLRGAVQANDKPKWKSPTTKTLCTLNVLNQNEFELYNEYERMRFLFSDWCPVVKAYKVYTHKPTCDTTDVKALQKSIQETLWKRGNGDLFGYLRIYDIIDSKPPQPIPSQKRERNESTRPEDSLRIIIQHLELFLSDRDGVKLCECSKQLYKHVYLFPRKDDGYIQKAVVGKMFDNWGMAMAVVPTTPKSGAPRYEDMGNYDFGFIRHVENLTFSIIVCDNEFYDKSETRQYQKKFYLKCFEHQDIPIDIIDTTTSEIVYLSYLGFNLTVLKDKLTSTTIQEIVREGLQTLEKSALADIVKALQ